MISFEEIRDVHLEISSLCNAACPLCPRNFRGYPHNDGYPEANMTLAQVQQIFDPNFVSQLTRIYLNGNFGDIVMNPETPDIVEYFRANNPNLIIAISTNGSGRDRRFWQRLASARAKVFFCLDGLEDTHHLYRQNTVWRQILRNAETFIAAGGYATWKFILFDHNQHQIQQCRELAEQLKFAHFEIINDGRNIGPVFDKHGQLTHVIGDYQGSTDFKTMFFKKKTDTVVLEDIIVDKKVKSTIACVAKITKSIYVTSIGEVYPCCFMGYYPRTYGQGEYHQAVNSQIARLMQNNNALDSSIKQCIEWFADVETSWKKSTYESGRLVVCDDNCGSC